MVPQALLVQLAERICISPKQKALQKEENDKATDDPERLISVLGFKYRKLKGYNEISKQRKLLKKEKKDRITFDGQLLFKEPRISNTGLTNSQIKQVMEKL